VKSKNIQYPEAGIQYQRIPARVVVAATWIYGHFLCNCRINSAASVKRG